MLRLNLAGPQLSSIGNRPSAVGRRDWERANLAVALPEDRTRRPRRPGIHAREARRLLSSPKCQNCVRPLTATWPLLPRTRRAAKPPDGTLDVQQVVLDDL